MQNQDILKTIVTSIFGSGILNIFITHFLYSKKLKKELKKQLSYDKNNSIYKKIEKSLCYFRDIELELSEIEIFDVEKQLGELKSNLDFFNQKSVYPAIFNTFESYNNFLEKIRDFRKKYEQNAPCLVSLFAVYIERYLFTLSIFITEHGGEELLPFWGMIFKVDIYNWQRQIDKLLTWKINKGEYRLASKYSLKYKIERKFVIEIKFKRTLLYYLLTGKTLIINKRKLLPLKKIFDEIKKNNKY